MQWYTVLNFLFYLSRIIIFIVPICCLTEINDCELFQVAKYGSKMGEVKVDLDKGS